MDDEVAELWRRVEHLRSQRMAVQREGLDATSKIRAETEHLSKRCVAAEARAAELERVLATERALRNKVAKEKGRLEAQLNSERDAFDIRMEEMQAKIRIHEQTWREERKRLKILLENLKKRLDQETMDLEHERILHRRLQDDFLALERDYNDVCQEKDDALSEIRTLSAKLEVYEKDVLPKAKEDQARLEAAIQRLQDDLEETMDSEAAFRALFLKEQSARKSRMVQSREEILDLMSKTG